MCEARQHGKGGAKIQVFTVLAVKKNKKTPRIALFTRVMPMAEPLPEGR